MPGQVTENFKKRDDAPDWLQSDGTPGDDRVSVPLIDDDVEYAGAFRTGAEVLELHQDGMELFQLRVRQCFVVKYQRFAVRPWNGVPDARIVFIFPALATCTWS